MSDVKPDRLGMEAAVLKTAAVATWLTDEHSAALELALTLARAIDADASEKLPQLAQNLTKILVELRLTPASAVVVESKGAEVSWLDDLRKGSASVRGKHS